MEMNEAKEKAKDVVDKVVVTSKDALLKAGSTVQKWSDIGVVKLEIVQLKSKRKNLVSRLGQYAEKCFLVDQAESVLISDPEVKFILQEIKDVDALIENRENIIKFKLSENKAQ